MILLNLEFFYWRSKKVCFKLLKPWKILKLFFSIPLWWTKFPFKWWKSWKITFRNIWIASWTFLIALFVPHNFDAVSLQLFWSISSVAKYFTKIHHKTLKIDSKFIISYQIMGYTLMFNLPKHTYCLIFHIESCIQRSLKIKFWLNFVIIGNTANL